MGKASGIVRPARILPQAGDEARHNDAQAAGCRVLSVGLDRGMTGRLRVAGVNSLAEGNGALLRLVDVGAGGLLGRLAVALAAVDRRATRCRVGGHQNVRSPAPSPSPCRRALATPPRFPPSAGPQEAEQLPLFAAVSSVHARDPLIRSSWRWAHRGRAAASGVRRREPPLSRLAGFPFGPAATSPRPSGRSAQAPEPEAPRRVRRSSHGGRRVRPRRPRGPCARQHGLVILREQHA